VPSYEIELKNKRMLEIEEKVTLNVRPVCTISFPLIKSSLLRQIEGDFVVPEEHW